MTSVQNEHIGIGKGPAATDSRLKRPADEARSSRSMDDRQFTDDRELKDPVRMESKRDEFLANILPNPPEIPGFKMIWLSTTHSADTIPERMRRGYSPVKLEEIPGFDAWQIKSGDWAGYIGVREMLLFKIPVEMWAEDMTYVHHTAPLAEEQGIRDSIAGIKNELEDGRATVAVSKGLQQLGQAVRKPKFT